MTIYNICEYIFGSQGFVTPFWRRMVFSPTHSFAVRSLSNFFILHSYSVTKDHLPCTILALITAYTREHYHRTKLVSYDGIRERTTDIRSLVKLATTKRVSNFRENFCVIFVIEPEIIQTFCKSLNLLGYTCGALPHFTRKIHLK